MARVTSTTPVSDEVTPVVSTDPDIQLVSNDQLTDSEREILAIFDKRAATADAPLSAETLPDAQASAEADGTGTESATAPEPKPSGADDVPSPETNADASTGDGPTDGEGQPEQTSEGGQESDNTAGSDTPFTFAGIPYTAPQLETAVRVHQWFSGLDQAQIGQIDALMSGQYQLVPVAQVASPPQGVSPTPAPAGQFPPSDSPSEGDWLDPQAKTEIDALKQQIAQLQQSIVPVAQNQQDLRTQHVIQEIDAAGRSFAQERGLSDDEMSRLGIAVRDSQIFPTFVQRMNGDNAAAMRAALDTLYWTTPEFRDRHVESQVQAGIQQLTDTDRSTRERQQQMTALSGAGGSAPRREPVPKDRASRQQAMIEEIAAASNGNGQAN